MSRAMDQVLIVDDSFWEVGRQYRIWRAGLPAVGPGEKFSLLAKDDMGVYLKYLDDNEWGRKAGDFTLFISWASINAARTIVPVVSVADALMHEEPHI